MKNKKLVQPSNSQFNKLKDYSTIQKNSKAESRIENLKKLSHWITQNQNKITEALTKDFNKPEFETLSSEISILQTEIKYFCQNLSSWIKPQKVNTPLTLAGYESFVHYEGKGVVLIIAPWNYPFLLALHPLITALAAGNCAVVKPSEITPHTSELIQSLILEIFSENLVQVYLGNKEVTEKLLQFDFDHVFFTGSTQVGRLIAMKCAEKLIPYTLELGGKSPTIIDETADIQDAAEKIYWSKFLNRGQTCVAPDYILVHQSKLKKLISEFNKIEKSMTEKPASMVNETHFRRVSSMVEDEKIDLNKTKCALVEIDSLDHALMQTEIFGPVAPVMAFSHLDEIFQILKKHPYPLALYIFSKNSENINQILNQTQSGGVAINSVIVHLANHHLPFGGIRSSGVGRYHGYDGFLELTHHRSVIIQKKFNSLLKLAYPPYTDLKKKLLSLI